MRAPAPASGRRPAHAYPRPARAVFALRPIEQEQTPGIRLVRHSVLIGKQGRSMNRRPPSSRVGEFAWRRSGRPAGGREKKWPAVFPREGGRDPGCLPPFRFRAQESVPSKAISQFFSSGKKKAKRTGRLDGNQEERELRGSFSATTRCRRAAN